MCDFPAAVLKGLIEHNDRGAYFGSTGALAYYTRVAVERGWVLSEIGPDRMPVYRVTLEGRDHYEDSGLKDFTHERYRRAYMLDWSKYKGPGKGQKG